MIHLYSDVSMDDDRNIMSVGYIIFESTGATRQKVDSGAKVIHTDVNERDIEWTTHKGEYFSAIIGVRAAQEYVDDEDSEMIVLHLDNRGTVKNIRAREWKWEDYFPHALFSFLERWDDYDVEMVHRDNNHRAHEQAHLGLRIGRDLLDRQGSLS